MQLPRSSGILLHPTSLPGGRLDADAYRFVDWLEAAGQSWWQVLPLGPPDEVGSPYRSASAKRTLSDRVSPTAASAARAETQSVASFQASAVSASLCNFLP